MIMFILAWHISVGIYNYLQAYAPTNIAIAWLRTCRGIKWAIPAALVATPLYGWAADALVDVLEHGGPPWLGFVAMLCLWNALKFAINALMTPFILRRLKLAHSSRVGTVNASSLSSGRLAAKDTACMGSRG